jgi:hypothetical protein
MNPIAMASAGLAQTPMSPIYPTGPKSPQPRPPTAITSAPATTNAAPAVVRAQEDNAPVATAVIPPPLSETPPASAEPKKPVTAPSEPDNTTARPAVVKRQKRTAKRNRYARRYYARPYYGTAAVSGWGGGQFGPAPYSTGH